MRKNGNIGRILLGCAVIVLGLVTLLTVDVLSSRLFVAIRSMLGPDATVKEGLLSMGIIGVLCGLLGISWFLLWKIAKRTGTMAVLLGCAVAVLGLATVFTVSGLPFLLLSASVGSMSEREPDAQAALNQLLFVAGPYVSLGISWFLLWRTARRAGPPWPAKMRLIALGCVAVVLGLATALTALSHVKAIEAWQLFNVVTGLFMLLGDVANARFASILHAGPYILLAALWLLLWGIARLTRPRSGNG